MELKRKIAPTKKWPEDWYQHLINTSVLYFENKNIKFERSVIFKSSFSVSPLYPKGFKENIQCVQLDFSIKDDEDYDYIATIKLIDIEKGQIVADICCLEDDIDDEEPQYEIINIGNVDYDEDKMIEFIKNIEKEMEEFEEEELVIIPVGETIITNNPYDCIVQIEKIIQYDYDNREDNDNGNNNGDDDCPLDDHPLDIINTEPQLSGA